LAARWWSARVGAAMALAVFSHFVLDVASHRPDMPLVGLGASHDVLLGTNLALHPLPFFLVELGWCLLAWWWYDPTNRRLLVTLLVMMVVWSNSIFGFSAMPELAPPQQAALTLVGFVLFAGILRWAAQPTEAGQARVAGA